MQMQIHAYMDKETETETNKDINKDARDEDVDTSYNMHIGTDTYPIGGKYLSQCLGS
jgi:hypothetical protein